MQEVRSSGVRTSITRDGATGGAWGGRTPQRFTEPALEFLKIFVHCRHSRNLLVMLLESVVAF